MITIYYTRTLCYPNFMYCLSIWDAWPSYLHHLTVAQNKILRCIFYMVKSVNICSTHKIQKHINVHKYFLLLCMFRNLTGTSSSKLFNLVTSTYSKRGFGVDLVCLQYRTTLYKESLVYSGPQLWNSLPINIKSLINRNSTTISMLK